MFVNQVGCLAFLQVQVKYFDLREFLISCQPAKLKVYCHNTNITLELCTTL